MAMEGRTLSGRYRLDALLGRGGMAEVYRGTDSVLHRTVAVKVLSSTLAGDEGFVARFRREARSAAGLNHPNVVSVFDTGSDGGLYFIVMEHVEGRTLAEALREGGPLPWDRACAIAIGVCEALGFAHEAGVIHRDVKPGNIMITPSGQVKLTDFGIARATASNDLTRTATVLGTAAYFSPEQARGDRVDHRSDIYSLGVVLYEMLAGHPPFRGDSPVAVAYKHLHEPPPLLPPGVPPGLGEVVARALAKEPAARYASAEDLAGDLERVRAGVPPAATSVPSTEVIQGDTTRVLPTAATRPAPVIPTAAAPPGAAPGRPGGGDRGWAWWAGMAVVIVALLAALVVLAILLTRDEEIPRSGSSPSPTATAASPTPTAPPTTTASPPASPTTPSPPANNVQDAYAALTQVLQDGVEAGEITPRAAGEIDRLARHAVREDERGEEDEALEKVDELKERVNDFQEDGQISSAERAELIRQAVSDLEAAIRA